MLSRNQVDDSILNGNIGRQEKPRGKRNHQPTFPIASDDLSKKK